MTYVDQVNYEFEQPHSITKGPGKVALEVLGSILRDPDVRREVQHELRNTRFFLEQGEIKAVFDSLMVTLQGGEPDEDDGEDSS